MAASARIRPPRPQIQKVIDDVIARAVELYGPEFKGVLRKAEEDAVEASRTRAENERQGELDLGTR